MRARYLLGIGHLLAALMGGCGGGGGGDEDFSQPPSSGGPNEGVGWIRIREPTSSATFTTDQSTVVLEGSSFIPVGFFCSPSLFPYYVPVPPGYEVRALNSSTSISLYVSSTFACVLGVPVMTWRTLAPLANGANSITLTVTDGAGNIGKSTIVITRVRDTTPPTVISVSPINGESGVAIDASVTVTFSEPMDQATINTATVILKDGANNPVIATVTYDQFSPDATLKPVTWLAKNTTYHATVTTEARDASGGNALAAPYAFSFTTGSHLQFPFPPIF